jgi:hypothetical protein
MYSSPQLWPSCYGTDEHTAFLLNTLAPTVAKKILYTIMQGNKLSNWPDKHFFCTMWCADLHSITAATFTFRDKIIHFTLLSFLSCLHVTEFSMLLYLHNFYVTASLMFSEGVITCLNFTGR